MLGTILGFVIGIVTLFFGALFYEMMRKEKELRYKDTHDEWGHKKPSNGRKNKKTFMIPFVLCLVSLVVFIFIPFSVKQVSTGEVAVVKVWGKTEYAKTAGTHFDFWLGKEYIRYDTKIRQINSQTMAYSQDAQTMDISLTIQYRIQADKVKSINEEFGSLSMLESRVTSVFVEKTKAVMSSMQAMKIIEERDSLPSKIVNSMSDLADKYYIEVLNVLIENIDFSDAFEQAVENKMISEQQQLQAEYEAKKAETEAKGKLEVAKLEAEAELQKALKEAEATEVRAEAEAKALQIIQEAWDSIDPTVQAVILQEMAIEKWDGKVPETMVGTDFLEWLMGSI